MRWIAEITEPKKLRAEIEKNQVHELMKNEFLDWYYLYVYEDGTETPQWDYDHETFEMAVNKGYSQFNIPHDAWKQVE